MLLYIGTYSARGSQGIYVFRFDPNGGVLTAAGSVSGGLNNLAYLALHPNNRVLYAASETGSGEVASFEIDSRTGMPHMIGRQSSSGAGPCHVAVDHKGTNVLVANYRGGTIAVLPILPDGALSPASAVLQEGTPSGINADGRQTAHYAHCIQSDSSDKFVVSTDLGCDSVFLYNYDADRGKLTPASQPSVATRPGAGPRHFAFHPTGDLVFVINELDSTVSTYRFDRSRGSLSEIQTLSTLPEGYTGKSYTAEIRAHPSGKYVYGSNRGHDSIVGYSVDTSGRLQTIGYFPTLGRTPRNFGIDPTGTWLIAANQDTDDLVVFRIDGQSGRLSATGATVAVPSPVCVTFAAN